MDDIIVVIPSYKPDIDIMSNFMKELRKEFKNIVIVNDGSGKEYDNFFDTFEDIAVLKHCVNLGKGRAIKTAFNYIHNTYPNFKCIVTADCDGQHTIEDIKKCGQAAIKNPSSLILGVRDFNQDDVPKKSRYGNKITRNIFKIFIGLNITDTQTGLRAFSKKLVEQFITTNGERYEYETNMLIDCKVHDISIKEITIKTVYINNNKTSHFNPLRDSIMIYKLFVKYIISSLSSFLLDIALFTLFVNIITNNILIATIMARIISSLYNFFINGRLVFKKISRESLIKYAILVIIQMFISGYTVSYLSNILHISSTLIKVIVDSIIFVINFIIQREWVFKKNR
jgi:putative flippase GtrA